MSSRYQILTPGKFFNDYVVILRRINVSFYYSSDRTFQVTKEELQNAEEDESGEESGEENETENQQWIQASAYKVKNEYDELMRKKFN